MCNRFVQNDQVVKPGQRATVLMRGPGGTFEMEYDGAVFSGAARDDNRKYWIKREHGEEVLVPGISRYGEANKATGVQSWEDVPAGSTMEGVLLPKPPGKDYRLLKVITQDAGPMRTAALGNDRSPIFSPPLGDIGIVTTEAPKERTKNKSEKPEQPDLFA